MRIEKLVLSAVCTAVMCTAVSAQEAKPNPASVPQQSSEKQGTNKSFQGTVTPEQFATCWALDNQEEIILAKFAQEKSKNKEVIQFAKMIAEEHQACLKKLSKFAPEASREGYLVTNHANQSVPKMIRHRKRHNGLIKIPNQQARSQPAQSLVSVTPVPMQST